MISDLAEFIDVEKSDVNHLRLGGVVRVSRSYWSDNRAAHEKTTISWLKRKSPPAGNFLQEDVSATDAQDVLERIVDLHTHPNGLYTVEMTNISRNWESGDIDDYDYMLIPYTE